MQGCEVWKNYKSIEEYKEDVVKCLMYSTWRYTEKQANEIVDERAVWLKHYYKSKTPADVCCAEIGFYGG